MAWPSALLLLALLGSLLWPHAARANTAFTVGVVPQFTAVDIGLRWTPLLERLQKETGIRMQIRTHASIPEFEEEFLKGIPDLVYLNPYHMVMAAKAQGYRPLIRSTRPLNGILVAHKNGPAKRLSDLDGGILAFPAPNAFGASLYMRALLSEREKTRFTANYVGTHQNVYRHVLMGDALAGGGIETTLENEPDGVRNQLVVLYRTPDTASHPFAVHPRVPQEIALRIQQVLQRMANDQEGRKLLQQVELDGAASADYTRDYGPLEALRLDRHVVLKKK